MNNRDVATVFDEIADLLSFKTPTRFAFAHIAMRPDGSTIFPSR